MFITTETQRAQSSLCSLCLCVSALKDLPCGLESKSCGLILILLVTVSPIAADSLSDLRFRFCARRWAPKLCDVRRKASGAAARQSQADARADEGNRASAVGTSILSSRSVRYIPKVAAP